jgi:FixJ family two-component response regulator
VRKANVSQEAGGKTLLNEEVVVHIVDDDDSVRSALSHLLRSVGYVTRTHPNAEAFLQDTVSDALGCVILDVRLPGASGLKLQEHLNKLDIRLPLVLISGHSDIPMSVKAMKAGAVDFLTKPFRDQDMLDAVDSAIELHRSRRNSRLQFQELKERFDRLSPRERQVMTLACSGRLNKQIASELSIKEITVKVHRASVMKKMRAKSLAELARMAQILDPAG